MVAMSGRVIEIPAGVAGGDGGSRGRRRWIGKGGGHRNMDRVNREGKRGHNGRVGGTRGKHGVRCRGQHGWVI